MAASPAQPTDQANPAGQSATDRRHRDQKNRLSPQQARFVREYVIDFKPQRAAIAAGYTQKSANSLAYQLLQIPKIQDEIERIHARELEKTSQLIARQVRETTRIAFSDPRLFFDDDGHPLPIHELPDDAAHALASFEVESIETKRTRDDDAGETIERETTVTKYKLWSKIDALGQLGKYTGILREKDNAAASDAPTRTEVTITLVQAQPRNPDPVADLEPTRATIQQPANYGTAAVEVKLIGAAADKGPDGTT